MYEKRRCTVLLAGGCTAGARARLCVASFGGIRDSCCKAVAGTVVRYYKSILLCGWVAFVRCLVRTSPATKLQQTFFL